VHTECRYGDWNVWLSEYENYCRKFDEYLVNYNKWQCLMVTYFIDIIILSVCFNCQHIAAVSVKAQSRGGCFGGAVNPSSPVRSGAELRLLNVFMLSVDSR